MSSATGSLASVGDVVALTGNGELTTIVSFSGTFSNATVGFQVSPDGTNWYDVSAWRLADNSLVASAAISAAASFAVPNNGMRCRAKVTAIGGSITSMTARLDGVQLPIGTVLPSPTPNVSPATSLSAVAANGNGTTIDFGTCVRTFSLQTLLTGTPTGGTVVLQLSNDGTNWSPTITGSTFTIGAQVSGEMVFVSDKPARYARAVLAGLTGGTSPTVTTRIAGAA